MLREALLEISKSLEKERECCFGEIWDTRPDHITVDFEDRNAHLEHVVIALVLDK